MKIAILTRSDYRSPRVLANSLKLQLEQDGVEIEIIYEINLLSRLVSLKESGLNFHFWLKRKLQYFSKDVNLLRKLKKFDTIIISECTPNGFIRRLYNVEKFKRIIRKPVGLYEVYYLGNAPTKIDSLKKSNNALFERFDFHLSVSNVTEIKSLPSQNYYSIGIFAQSWKLKPLPKKEILAVVDFIQPGYEQYRKFEIAALNKAGIKYISLEKQYSFEEIRNIYQRSAIFFIQFPEAFGVSILECLCCGCQIFTRESSWPMSWRLNENPETHGEGSLPDCFTIYKNENELEKELAAFKENYDLTETPKKVFANFLAHYPQFYYGNEKESQRLLLNLKSLF